LAHLAKVEALAHAQVGLDCRRPIHSYPGQGQRSPRQCS
jgi:hypothetical protein